jgi:hypothetical protein
MASLLLTIYYHMPVLEVTCIYLTFISTRRWHGCGAMVRRSAASSIDLYRLGILKQITVPLLTSMCVSRTIEEKILQRQAHKKALSSCVVDEEEVGHMFIGTTLFNNDRDFVSIVGIARGSVMNLFMIIIYCCYAGCRAAFLA